jgi:hypothetical protein
MLSIHAPAHTLGDIANRSLQRLLVGKARWNGLKHPATLDKDAMRPVHQNF